MKRATARAQLVVMVRAPRLGLIKRRLARDVGALAAWRFYRQTTARLLRRVGRDPRWRTVLAVTPDRGWRRSELWGFRGEILPQGGGDLGTRMGRLLQRLPPGPVVVVGSDIPGLGRDQVARAFLALGRHDWVLGPAPDGGYWLIGTRRRPTLRLPFARVRWSSEHARADTLAGLKGARIAFMEELQDVDNGDDLARLKTSRLPRPR